MAVYPPPMPKTMRRRTRLLVFAPLALAACGGGPSPYQGMTAEELFELASVEFEEGDHGNAIKVLDRLLLTQGDWERLPEARLLLGNVYFDREDYLTARTEYDRFLDRYAGHEDSPDAALGVCQSLARLAPTPQRDQGYSEEAITSCRNVVIDFAGLPQSIEAGEVSSAMRLTLAEKEFLNAEFYFRRNIWDSAIKYYEFVMTLYPDSEFAAPSLLGIFRSNQLIESSLFPETRTWLPSAVRANPVALFKPSTPPTPS